MAGTKNCGAHAHHGGTFLDGDLEVVTHAHRQLPERLDGVAVLDQPISQFPEPAKVWAHRLGVVQVRRQDHQPDHLCGVAAGCRVENRPNVLGRCAVLGRLTGEIHLNQRGNRSAGLEGAGFQAFNQVWAVDGLNDGQMGGRSSSLVRLQMADEVPFNWKVGRSLNLL